MSEIILLHGFWSHPEVTRPLRRHLERHGHRVHALTFPGHDPEDPWPEQKLARLSLGDCTAFVRQYIHDQNFSSPPLLMGHSMGGLVAQMVAAEEPASGVILLNSAAPAGINHILPSAIRTNWNILTTPFFWKKAVLPNRAGAHYGLFNRMPVRSAESIYESLVPESGRMFSELVFWFLDRSKTTRIEKEIDAPILILTGGMDRIVPSPVGKALHRRYPLATKLCFPASGHWLFHEFGSRRVFAAISDWIETIPERRRFIEEQKNAHHDPGLFPSSPTTEISSKQHFRDDSPRDERPRDHGNLDQTHPLRRSPDKNPKSS